MPRVKIFKKGTNYKLAKGNFSGMTETFDMKITVMITQLYLFVNSNYIIKSGKFYCMQILPQGTLLFKIDQGQYENRSYWNFFKSQK